MHLGHSAGRGDSKQEGTFPGQVLEWAGHYGLKLGLGEGCQNQLQTPHGYDHSGDALGVLMTFKSISKV